MLIDQNKIILVLEPEKASFLHGVLNRVIFDIYQKGSNLYLELGTIFPAEVRTDIMSSMKKYSSMIEKIRDELIEKTVEHNENNKDKTND